MRRIDWEEIQMLGRDSTIIHAILRQHRYAGPDASREQVLSHMVVELQKALDAMTEQAVRFAQTQRPVIYISNQEKGHAE